MGELVPVASTSGALIAKQKDPETALVQYEKRLKEVRGSGLSSKQVVSRCALGRGAVSVLVAARERTPPPPPPPSVAAQTPLHTTHDKQHKPKNN